MKKIVYFLVLSLVVAACGAPKEQPAAAEKTPEKPVEPAPKHEDIPKVLSSFWEAEVSLQKEDKAPALLSFLIKDPKSVPGNYEPELILSTSAYKIYQEIDTLQLKDIHNVEIVLNRNDTLWDKTFPIQELSDASGLINHTSSLFSMHSNGNYLGFTKMWDRNLMPDNTIEEMYKVMTLIDSTDGSISRISLMGFNYETVTADSLPALMSIFEVQNGGMLNYYTFYTNRDSQKLLHMALNN